LITLPKDFIWKLGQLFLRCYALCWEADRHPCTCKKFEV
jgi:hypothetical protein